MPNSRTGNAARNIVFGSVNRFVTLVLPFVTRTIILYLLGASFLGIGTLFSSILSFLSLTELGLSSAIVYSMYKPIVENDTETVGALLNYYRKLYRIIGIVILTMGTLLVPAVPFLIKGDSPDGIDVYVLYYLYLLNSVISYFFAGYRQSLLTAHQRTDITSNISTVVNFAVQAGQILVLYLTRSFYAYAIVPICGTLIVNLLNSIITKRKFPDIKCSGVVSLETKKSIQKKLSGLFGTKLNSIVVHSSDTIIISAFLGLTMTAQYGNYYYIMNAVCGFIMVFFSSMTAGIGNKLVTDSIDQSYGLFKNLSFINAWLVGWCSICFLCLYEPFMAVWVGEELQLGFTFVLLMVGYFYIYEIQRTILVFKDAAGLWNKDKYRPYVSMVINVVSNLILVNIIGIYGIVLSTILAFLISVPWVNHVLFRYLFKKPAIRNLWAIFKYLIITLLVALPTYFICSFCPDGIVGVIVRLIICCVLPNILFLLFFFKTQELSYVLEKLKLNKILNKLCKRKK